MTELKCPNCSKQFVKDDDCLQEDPEHDGPVYCQQCSVRINRNLEKLKERNKISEQKEWPYYLEKLKRCKDPDEAKKILAEGRAAGDRFYIKLMLDLEKKK